MLQKISKVTDIFRIVLNYLLPNDVFNLSCIQVLKDELRSNYVFKSVPYTQLTYLIKNKFKISEYQINCIDYTFLNSSYNFKNIKILHINSSDVTLDILAMYPNIEQVYYNKAPYTYSKIEKETKHFLRSKKIHVVFSKYSYTNSTYKYKKTITIYLCSNKWNSFSTETLNELNDFVEAVSIDCLIDIKFWIKQLDDCNFHNIKYLYSDGNINNILYILKYDVFINLEILVLNCVIKLSDFITTLNKFKKLSVFISLLKIDYDHVKFSDSLKEIYIVGYEDNIINGSFNTIYISKNKFNSKKYNNPKVKEYDDKYGKIVNVIE